MAFSRATFNPRIRSMRDRNTAADERTSSASVSSIGGGSSNAARTRVNSGKSRAGGFSTAGTG